MTKPFAFRVAAKLDAAACAGPDALRSGCRLELRAAGAEGAETLVQAGPCPRLDLAVALHGLVPRGLEVLEPGVGLLDLEQFLGFANRPGEGVVVIVHGPDSRTRTGRRCTLPPAVPDERYERGWERLRELAGEHGERVIEGVRDVSPDLARYVVEFGYGDVYTRPGLDDRTRQLAAISALTALGGAEPQLEYHIGIALNVGVEPREIVETIVHLAPFLGFARTLNAARSAKRVFAARGVSPAGES